MKFVAQVQIKETLTCSTDGTYEPDEGFACPVYSSAPSQTLSSCTFVLLVSVISRLIIRLSWGSLCIDTVFVVKGTVLYHVFNQKWSEIDDLDQALAVRLRIFVQSFNVRELSFQLWHRRKAVISDWALISVTISVNAITR